MMVESGKKVQMILSVSHRAFDQMVLVEPSGIRRPPAAESGGDGVDKSWSEAVLDLIYCGAGGSIASLLGSPGAL